MGEQKEFLKQTSYDEVWYRILPSKICHADDERVEKENEENIKIL